MKKGIACARWAVIEDDFLGDEPLVIKDLGPWTDHPTITNDVEAVVADLYATSDLKNGRRLFYIDSEGNKEEILHADGAFVDFAPGPGRFQADPRQA